MAERGRPRAFDRDEALRRAMETFWRRGYAGASVSDLAEVMGINKPSLYAAFGSKEALFREAVALYDAVEGEAASRALAEEPTARRAVEAMLRCYAEAYTSPGKPPGCMIVLAATLGGPENDEVCAHLSALRRSGQSMLRKRLERGVAEGDVSRAADVAAMAAFYSAVLEGLSIQARDGASRKTLNAVIDCAMAAWPALTRRRRAAD